MRRFLSICFILVLCLTSISAEAGKKPVYTLPVKDSTALQNIPDRNITPQTEAVRHEQIAGESPVTGLPWEGVYLPMLVQISNQTSLAKVNGYTVESAGIGKCMPWGIQYADIAYEQLLIKTGQTRLSMLFSDCFSKGQPTVGVGPVRSTRMGQLLLREEWQSGFVYNGGFGGTLGWRDQKTAELFRQTGALEQGVLFDLTRSIISRDFRYRVKGIKAPNNYNVDIKGLRGLIPDTFICQPRPFLFADENPYVAGYELADTVNLDWGATETISHFIFDECNNVYLRYCGAGMKEAKWVPYVTYASAQDQSEGNQQQLFFSNLIVQRVTYEYPDYINLPDMQGVGKGNADIFIGGRYIPGYWVRASIADPTVYYDDQGNELMLSRGKTFIAQFPTDALCTFTAGME